MTCFAAHGSEAASLRMVADAADVSIGLVQHHFGSKSALIDVVDEELFAILQQAAPPFASPAPDPVADVGHRLTRLIAEQPDAIDYLARLLIDDQRTGREFLICFSISADRSGTSCAIKAFCARTSIRRGERLTR